MRQSGAFRCGVWPQLPNVEVELGLDYQTLQSSWPQLSNAVVERGLDSRMLKWNGNIARYAVSVIASHGVIRNILHGIVARRWQIPVVSQGFVPGGARRQIKWSNRRARESPSVFATRLVGCQSVVLVLELQLNRRRIPTISGWPIRSPARQRTSGCSVCRTRGREHRCSATGARHSVLASRSARSSSPAGSTG